MEGISSWPSAGGGASPPEAISEVSLFFFLGMRSGTVDFDDRCWDLDLSSVFDFDREDDLDMASFY